MTDQMMHYGIKKKSGRYPWGSGGDEYTRSMDFNTYVSQLKRKGIPEKDIAKIIGEEAQVRTGDPRAKFTVNDLRSTTTIAKEEVVREQTHRAVRLRDKGTSIQAISDELGIPAPTVRLRLKNSENMKESALTNTTNVLRDNVNKHEIVDIGKGTELQMGISPEKLKAAASVLRDEGYETYTLQTPQPGNKQFTNQLVMVKPGTGFGNAKRMTPKIHTIGEWTEDDGKTFFGIHKPLSVDSKRLKVRFKEDGGEDADGLIEVRPGVKDLDMGKNKYAQVRILIDNEHYIKGMAVLNPDLPPGTDLVFNTNKSKTVGKLGALKGVERDKDGNIDPDNPFGSMINRQITVKGKDGKDKVTSALNLVNEEGQWDDWRKSLPSQVLSKQPHSLIKSQLTDTRSQVRDRLAELDKITNPVVRKKKLEDIADEIDADAVDLRAAAMPRQRTQVIIPMPNMKKGEIYAPRFETGEKVVLVRYPHGGRFEIPEVTVNNASRTAKKLLGDAADAIGIHPSVASRLSGADFDGDTVVVIPNRAGKVKGSKSMGSQAKIFDDGLKNFDPKRVYGDYQVVGKKVNKKGDEEEIGNFPLMKNTGLEMGKITNLITDMSVQGAKPEHVLRAVKHSMVVIDAEKHKLNYKQSEADNGIKQLRQLYQATMKPDGSVKVGGASTLLSQATGKDRVPQRQPRRMAKGGPVDEKTGAMIYEPTGRTNNKYDPKTKTYDPNVKVPITENIKRLALTDDAYTLVRDRADPVERLYADHANEMKSLANAARLKAYRIQSPKRNKTAAAVYKPEVDKLVADLNAAKMQKPLERRANVYANTTIKAKRQEDPTLREDPDRLKKVERQARSAAWSRLDLHKHVIDISDRQWDAIQAGAVSSSRLREILGYADPKRVDELAVPRSNPVMSKAITSRAKSMLAAGATSADVAAALGVPLSTLRSAALRGDLA